MCPGVWVETWFVTNKLVHSESNVGDTALIVEEGTVCLSHPSLDSGLVSLQSSEARAVTDEVIVMTDQVSECQDDDDDDDYEDHLLDGVDGEASQGVGHGVGLELADGLHPAGLILNIHVVEADVHDVKAETERQINYTEWSERRQSVRSLDWPSLHLIQSQGHSAL